MLLGCPSLCHLPLGWIWGDTGPGPLHAGGRGVDLSCLEVGSVLERKCSGKKGDLKHRNSVFLRGWMEGGAQLGIACTAQHQRSGVPRASALAGARKRQEFN